MRRSIDTHANNAVSIRGLFARTVNRRLVSPRRNCPLLRVPQLPKRPARRPIAGRSPASDPPRRRRRRQGRKRKHRISSGSVRLLDISNSISSVSNINGLLLSKNESCYNSRTKYYISDSGQYIPYETMICNRPLFVPSNLETAEYSRNVSAMLDERSAMAECFGGERVYASSYKSAPLSKSELLDASRRRARRKIFDYCICNDFDLFVTLTLDKSLIDRNDYGSVIKKLNTFLDNRVRRKGLKYIGVPEYHRNGGLHFHFAMTSNAFKLVDSGTVSVEGHKKPVKISTADRWGVDVAKRHTVYNVVDWKLGFSTAIYRYGDRGSFAHYLSKELCKPIQKSLCDSGSIDKIGGRWYYHGGKLNQPHVELFNTGFESAAGYSYDLYTDGGQFKIYKYNEDGVIIK